MRRDRGSDGDLAVKFRRLADAAIDRARPLATAAGGLLACETGIAQHQALVALATAEDYARAESHADLTGRERFLLAFA